MHNENDLREALAGPVTPGPWMVSGVRQSVAPKLGPDTRLHAVGPDGDAVAMVFYDVTTGRGYLDARLIVAAVNAAPSLLSDLDTARARIVELEAEVARTREVLGYCLDEIDAWRDGRNHWNVNKAKPGATYVDLVLVRTALQGGQP